ncbi:MAG: survival protein SurE [Actinobacteria bacterium]|nr:survival protein SurE [Actinomycetota bacterium]
MRGRHLVKRSVPLAAVLLAASIAAPVAAAPAGASAAGKKPKPITVLVTNDDGVAAPGMDAVVEALRTQKGVKVVVVAPATNQSGSGSKTTPGGAPGAPATTASGYEAYAVTGFPADAVNYAFDELGIQPNVVISGSNLGQNMGTISEISGTVGAARQAARRGIPALAVSSQIANPDFQTAAELAVEWLRENRKSFTKKAKVDGTARTEIESINVPTCPGGVKGLYETVLAPEGTTEPLVTGDPVNCASTLSTFTSDAQAFNNGWASIAKVTVPATAG